MSHVRQQIRDAVVTAVTGLTTTGSNVFASRVYPVEDSSLPCLAVFTNEESAEHLTMSARGSRPMNRVLELVVAGVAQATSSLDDTLDTIIKEAEEAIAADPTLGGIARDSMLTEISIELEPGDKPTGTARMSFQVGYVVAENDVETAL